MPRTIDSIMECHRAASERRAGGRPIWDRSIKFKSLLNQPGANASAEYVSELARRIASMIRREAPASYFDLTSDDYEFDFNDVIEAMESCTVECLQGDLENGYEPQAMLNGWLDELYTWADRNRIWTGP